MFLSVYDFALNKHIYSSKYCFVLADFVFQKHPEQLTVIESADFLISLTFQELALIQYNLAELTLFSSKRAPIPSLYFTLK